MYYIYIYNIPIYCIYYMSVSLSIYKYAAVSNGKRKPRRFSLILPFAHGANRGLSFVRLLTKTKKPEVIRFQTDYTGLRTYAC